MKKILLLTAFFALIFGFKAEAKAPDSFGFGIFYSSLEPHGQWMELEPGFVAWRPTIMHRWTPYQSGRWVWTEYGWYWDSYEPFGHITYHYGRWYYDDYYGWIWIPDYEWAPAWVEWRYDDDYIGWAPLPPYATFSVNIGIVFTNSYHTPYNHWHYVDYGHFCDPYPYNYYIPEKHKYRVHSRTKYRSDYSYRGGGVYNRGVDYEYVRERSGRDIEQRELYRTSDINDLRSRGGRNDDRIRTFSVSRDELRKNNDGLRDAKFERSDRKSSLNTSKVEIGERFKRDDRNTEPVNRKGKNELRTSDRNTEPVNKSGKDDRFINKRNNQDLTDRSNVPTDRKKNDVLTNSGRDNNRQNKQESLLKRQEDTRKQNDKNLTTQTLRKQKTEVNSRNNDFQQRKNSQEINKDVNRQFTEQKKSPDMNTRSKDLQMRKNNETVNKDVNRQNSQKKQFEAPKNTERKQRTESITRNEKREEVKRNSTDTRDNDKNKSERETGRQKQR